MTQALGPALEQALAYYRAPAQLAGAASRPLPEQMLNVLRLAAGDEALQESTANATGELPETVREAAVFYVQQVLFAPGSDHYRLLGVSPGSPDAQIKEHYRWLVRWLHPDRNQDGWVSVYADRVNGAWQALRLPERRRDYDAALPKRTAAAAVVPASAAGWPVGVGSRALAPTLMAPRTVQRLPVIVLGGLGAAAVLVLGLMWYGSAPPARQPGPQTLAVESSAELSRLATSAIAGQQQSALPASPPAAATLDEPGAPAPDAPLAPDVVVERAGEEATVAAVATPAVAPGLIAVPAEAPAPAPADPPGAAPTLPPVTLASRVPETESSPAPTPLSARATPAEPPYASSPSAASLAVEPGPPTPVEPAAAAPPALREQDARALLGQFSDFYAAGDVTLLMRLFTADARNNQGGREAIAYDYQALFSGTSQRQLTLTPTGWIQGSQGNATLLARYEAQVTANGRRRAEISRGLIRFDLRQDGGRLLISRVQHEL